MKYIYLPLFFSFCYLSAMEQRESLLEPEAELLEEIYPYYWKPLREERTRREQLAAALENKATKKALAIQAWANSIKNGITFLKNQLNQLDQNTIKVQSREKEKMVNEFIQLTSTESLAEFGQYADIVQQTVANAQSELTDELSNLKNLIGAR